MSKIYFLKNTDVIYDVEITQIGKNQLRLEFVEPMPSDNILLSGFNLVNENNGYIMADRTDYIYKYRTYSNNLNKIELCNDGVAWIKSDHTTRFSIEEGGALDGEIEQKVENYRDLSIPTINTETGFEFLEWKPAIPEEGEIKRDDIFHALLLDKNVYFHVSGGGTLEGEARQFVSNYNELVVPKTTPEENYKFVSWMPEIPKDGVVSMDNKDFYAVFESNIPDRIKTVESDLTDTQMGLIENYESALATMEEVTDLQLALVEVYNLITGGI